MSCRICLQKADIINKRFLIDPCDCKGSQRYVHKDCLKRWVDISKKYESCPTCQSQYSVRFHLFNKDLIAGCKILFLVVILKLIVMLIYDQTIILDMVICCISMTCVVEFTMFVFSKDRI